MFLKRSSSHQPPFPGKEVNPLCLCILTVLSLAAVFDNVLPSRNKLKTTLWASPFCSEEKKQIRKNPTEILSTHPTWLGERHS